MDSAPTIAGTRRTLICWLPRVAGAQVSEMEEKGLQTNCTHLYWKHLGPRGQTSSQAYCGLERLLTGFRPHSKSAVKWVLGPRPSRPSAGLSPLPQGPSFGAWIRLREEEQ